MKKNRRSNKKYAALNTSVNTKARRSYIEPDYINGVKNEKGETVIRALTEDEKEWLNKFYEETVITNFKRNGTDLFDSKEGRSNFYKDNYRRNLDLYNISQITGNLTYLEDMMSESYGKSYIDLVDCDSAQINTLHHNMVKEFIIFFDIKHGNIKNNKDSTFEFYKEWETLKGSFLKLNYEEFISIFDMYCKHDSPRDFYRLNINTKVGVGGEFRQNRCNN